MAAGVAGGVADHLDVPVFRVRLVFLLLVAAAGSGFFAYGALWVLTPLEPRGVPRRTSPRERQQGAAMATLGAGLALALSAVGDQIASWVVGPLGIALVGVAVVWREADTDGRPRGGHRRHGVVTRLVAGALLMTGGIVAFLVGRVDLSQVQFGLLAAVATLTGVVVLTVPWWLKLVRELSAERRARIRTQERAEIAAHLHDSVLQTLALIQKHSADDGAGREVRRLARRQERELRTWLYGARPDAAAPGGPAPGASSTLAATVTAVAGEVEDTYGVRVAPVVVGDAGLEPDPRGDLRAVVAATREAIVNAAKHSGADEISVYVEVEPDTVEIFVRDRGCGFDPGAVPDDRHGLAGSVHARMHRHGGRVRVRTAPGEGTEVALALPRRRDARPESGAAATDQADDQAADDQADDPSPRPQPSGEHAR